MHKQFMQGPNLEYHMQMYLTLCIPDGVTNQMLFAPKLCT